MNRLFLPLLLLVAGCQSGSPSPTAAASAAPTESAAATLPGPWASAAPPSAPPSAGPPAREFAGAAHILVAYKGAMGAAKTITRSKADAKKRAEEALSKLRGDKATFEQLVNEYSDDTASKPAGGKLGNFERNVMPPAFSDATFNLAVGGVSEVVETPRGFHIIRRTQ